MARIPILLTFCSRCGVASQLPVAATGLAPGPVPCRRCGVPLPIRRPEAVAVGRPVTVCAVCADDKLYTQKDFNQKVGCLILAVGAALVPWTWGLSLGVCALADLLLHRVLPTITVCYVCSSRYRGLPLNPDHQPYELMTAQLWEARSLNWKRLNAAAPETDPGRDQ